MVVDPPEGRVSILPEARAVRDGNLRRLDEHWVHNTPWERCITRGVPGMMFPTYNTGHLIPQTPGYVTISSEMIHLTRPIPLDDRPALPSNLRQWDGVPRGRWEGNTLVSRSRTTTHRGPWARTRAHGGSGGSRRAKRCG